MRNPVAVAMLALTGLSLLAGSAFAGNYHKGTFVIGGGFNVPVGDIDPYLNSSGTIFFAGGRNINQKLAIQVEYTHNWLAIDPSVIERAQTDSTQIQDAHSSLWSVSLNGIYRFRPENEFVPWITAGGGYYKRNLMLTQNALVYYPPIYDPWWGWIDGGWGVGEAIVGQRSDSSFGFNVGFGIDCEIDGGASLFIETRYHHAFMEGVEMQIVPIQAGVRW